MNFDQGYISIEMAQTRSALASDRAAHKLLGERKKPTATACELFRKTMLKYLQDERVGIGGARVSPFKDWPGKGVPQVTFPPARGWR